MSFTFDWALGRVNYYATLPGATDNLIVVPISFGGEAEATLRTRTTLAAVLTASTEHPAGRLVASLVYVADGVAGLETTDNGWLEPAAAAAISRVLICYRPDPASANSAILPLVSITTDNFTPDGVSDALMSFDPFFKAIDAVDAGFGEV